MRAAVAETIVATLSQFDLSYPEPTDKDREHFAEARAFLNGPDGTN